MNWFISSTGMFVTDCMAAFGCIVMGYLIGHSRGLNTVAHYHANLIDIHNALHALGLRSDGQAEEFNRKHVMKIVNMYARRGYSITK